MTSMDGKWALARLPVLLLLLAGTALIARGAAIPAKAWLAQIMLDRAFAASVASGEPVRAWPWADSVPVARIRLRRLRAEQIVLSGGSGEALAFGPALVAGGGRLGERGTAVIAAHRDTHFRFLGQVRPGDLIEVKEVSGRITHYRAEAARVVRRDRFGIDRHAIEPSLALVTCWPLDGRVRGPWRYVVDARMVRATGE
ncbi:MAG: class GN sortase [Pseudomonadota bacterium]|nr:class GN sortase [Pseudomonadota bacterium]